MNKKQHDKIHSLVPIYAALSRVQRLSVELFQSGKLDIAIDIRTEAEDGLAQLLMVEKEIFDGKPKIPRNGDKKFKSRCDFDSRRIEGIIVGCDGEETRGSIVRLQ